MYCIRYPCKQKQRHHHTWQILCNVLVDFFDVIRCAAFFGMPMLPLVMELGVEVLFPLSESVVGALLWLSGNANTLFVVLVADQLDIPRLGIYRRAPTFAFFWCVNAIGLFCMIRLRVRGGLRRKHYEDGRIGSEPVHRLRAPLLHTCRLNSC